MILKNPLLRSTQIVLFLNKYDLLQGKSFPIVPNPCLIIQCPAKIDAGVRFGHFVIAYGDRPNDAEAIAACKFSIQSRTHPRIKLSNRHKEEIW